MADPTSLTPENAVLDRLFELGRAVAGELDLPRVLKLAARTAASLVSADDVLVFTPREVADGPQGQLTLRVRLDDAAGPEASKESRELALASMRARAPQESHGPASALAAAPLVGGDRPLGCLVAKRRTKAAPAQPFSADELLRLRAVADYVALAVQAAEYFAEQQRHVRELSILNEVAAECAELGLDRLLPAVTQRISAAVEADVAALLFLDTDREELLTGAVSAGGNVVQAPRGRLQVTAGLCMKALSQRQSRRGLVEELGVEELSAFATARGLTHAVAVPLLVKDRAIGVALVARGTRVTDDEQRLLGAVCAEIAVAVENARLFAEAQRRAGDLELVVQLGEVVTRSLDPAEIMREAAERLSVVLECDAARIYVRSGEGFVSAVERGLQPAVAKLSERVGDTDPTISRGLAASGPIDLAQNVLPEPTFSYLEKMGLQRLAVAPLRVAARQLGDEVTTVGMLILGRRAARPFVEAELKLLGAVSTQLAVALQNARLFEETRRRMEDLAVVSEAGRALVGAAKLEEALDEVAERLARLTNVRDCMILLLDRDKNELYAVASSHKVRAHRAFTRIPMVATSLAVRAVLEGRPQSSGDVRNDPGVYKPVAVLMESTSCTALPLLAANRALGVIVLADPEKRRVLSDDEIARAMAIGNQVASAIERARLNTALERSLVELAQAQAQLVRRERLAALGELAALVAHEVRNPLGVIFNSLGSLAKLVNLEGDARRVYDIIREESMRLDRIVGDMLDYTRPQEPLLRPGSLDRVLRDAVASANAAEQNRGLPIDRIETVLHVAQDLPAVPMDERLVHQALVNVLSNAYQSMPKGGRVEIDARVHEGARRTARIRITDDGPGIPADVKRRLFEPFFTTKATGSGLGLAVVKRIIEGHRGEVDVVTSTGVGTTFLLDLPLDPGGGSALPDAG